MQQAYLRRCVHRSTLSQQQLDYCNAVLFARDVQRREAILRRTMLIRRYSKASLIA